jgi:transcriptional regulator with XRE-family HTH domain
MNHVPQYITDLRRALGQRLAAQRTNAGLTQGKLAAATSMDRTMISHLEAGRRRTGPTFWRAADEIFGGSDVLLTAFREIESATRRYTDDALSDGETGSVFAEAVADDSASVMDILGPADTLTALETMTHALIERYELDGPHLLASETLALRRLCHQSATRISGSERIRVTRITAQLEALLAYMAVNLKSYGAADRFAMRASLLATAIKDRPLLAWIKGTQSFAAYYQQRYRDALGLAHAGVRLAGSDPQRIRLLSNGVARAAGKIGDRALVDRATAEALSLAENQRGRSGMTSCIDLEPYGVARTAANAATAYLSLGHRARVLELTGALTVVVADSDSDWSRALVALDEAAALSRGDGADVEQAAALGLSALEVSATKPISSVNARAEELIASLQLHGTHPATAQLAGALKDWRLGAPASPMLPV